MKTASILQFLALSACLAGQFHGTGEFRMPGVGRAMQTMAGAKSACIANSVPGNDSAARSTS
jgi:hypothetical protein